MKITTALLMLAAVLFAAVASRAGTPNGSAKTSAASAASGVVHSANDSLEGEKRFRANCGRCHQAPHKFPPRMMATIVRHMRVRATITEEDMRLILAYMTQ